MSNPPAQAGPEASTQRELQEDAALHVLGRRECLLWRLGIEDMVFYLASRRCVLIDDLCHQVKELQEEVCAETVQHQR